MQITLQIIHELVKFAGLLLLGRGLVYVLSFGRHEVNPIYQFFRFLTSPLTNTVRKMTPAFVVDRHIPIAAFFLIFWLYVVLIFLRLEFVKTVA
jgi:uncharacterized protein YggT (Ycf19 family)